MAEAIMVATALKAGSAMAHDLNALQAYDGENNEELYKKSNMSRFKEFIEISPKDYILNDAWTDQEKGKELIAIAVVHVTGCTYCIDIHTKNAKKLGLLCEELAKAIFVATALKAGTALAHSINALNAYDL